MIYRLRAVVPSPRPPLINLVIFVRRCRQGAFSESEAAIIMHQILSTLESLHDDHSIVHRDLKPENILLR